MSVGAVSGTTALGGVDSRMDLATLMFTVQAERANVLDGQVRTQAETIKAKNELLKQANVLLAQMNGLKNTAGDGSSTMPAAMKEFCTANGIQTDRSGKDDVHNKAEWDVNIGHMKAFIDGLTSTSQLDMTGLQSTMNKYNQTFESLSNFVSKYSQSLNTLTGNLR